MQKTLSSPSLVKIRTSFAQIIVRKIKEKPYFEILYFDSQDKCFHIGFGSFCLEYVFQWLVDEFEIIEGISEMDYGRFQFVEETDHTEKGETMGVRERLIELLKTDACPSPFMCDPTCRYYGYGDCFPDRFADHLIANGVTVQKWISVTERLPEEEVNCIVHYVHAYCDDDGYWAIGVCFYDGEKFRSNLAYKVTHWMPLPQPPYWRGGQV